MAKGNYGEDWNGPYRVVDVNTNDFHGEDYIVRMDANGKDASDHPGEQDVDWEYVYIPKPEARLAHTAKLATETPGQELPQSANQGAQDNQHQGSVNPGRNAIGAVWEEMPHALVDLVRKEGSFCQDPTEDGADDHAHDLHGWEDIKTGAMTLPQEQREWEMFTHGLEYPGEPVHTFPNGYSIQRHDTPESAAAVGGMMRNCWQGVGDHWDNQANGGFTYNSLHDEHDIPRAAFYIYNNPATSRIAPRIFQPLAARNKMVDSAHAPMIADYAKQIGADFSGERSPDEWLAERLKWAQSNERMALPEINDEYRLGKTTKLNRAPHFNWITGQPCSCTFGPQLAMEKTAGKLEWLQGRPDMQTPEKAPLLDHLGFMVHEHGEKVDPLLPWLAREHKKGRVRLIDRQDEPFRSRWMAMNHPLYPNTYEQEGQPATGDLRIDNLLPHWADWYHSAAPNRKGVDIMQLKAPEMYEKVNEWDNWMKEKAAEEEAMQQNDAPIMHQWPDNWTVRKLNPEHLEYEGNKMGHCVGGFGYEDQVRNGTTHIYSLRDPKGGPHATIEVNPYSPPHGYGPYANPTKGEIVQIQGKGNEVPNPEYQQRLKEWFQTYPEEDRPNFRTPYDERIRHIGSIDPNAWSYDPHTGEEYQGEPRDEEDRYDQGGYGAHDDYGLVVPHRQIDYRDTIDSLLRAKDENEWHNSDRGSRWGIAEPTHEPREVKALYDEALHRKEIPQFAAAVEDHGNFAQRQYELHEANNWEQLPEYPGESYDDHQHPDDVADDYNREFGGTAPLPENPAEREAVLKDYWQPRLDYYHEAQGEMEKQVPELQLSNELYKYLNPHYWNETGPDGKTLGWQNELAPTKEVLSAWAPAPHPHITTGLPCTCPWGSQRLSKTAGSKMEWLESRPDKFKATEDGQYAFSTLKHIMTNYPEADALAPWIWREMKKGRIDGNGTIQDDYHSGYIGNRLEDWVNWYNSKSDSRKGVDIMQLDVNQMQEKMDEYTEEQEALEAEKILHHGTIMHHFDHPEDANFPYQGWTVRRVDNTEQAYREGEEMGHCAGSYGSNIEHGETGMFSLRDPRNKPYATIEINQRRGDNDLENFDHGDDTRLVRPHGGTLQQIQGRFNEEPDYRHKELLREWFEQLQREGGPLSLVEKEGQHFPAAEDPRALLEWYEGEGGDHHHYDEPDHYTLSPDQAEEYGVYGNEPEHEYEPPDWSKIVHSLLHDTMPDYRTNGRGPTYDNINAQEVRRIHDEASYEGELERAAAEHHHGLAQEFYHSVYDPREYEGPAPVQWNNWHKGQKMNTILQSPMSLPYAPDETPYNIQLPHEVHPDQTEMFQEVNYSDPRNSDYYLYPQYNAPGNIYSKLAVERPFYHVAPTSARESIQEKGLIGHLGEGTQSPWNQMRERVLNPVEQPAANYAFQDEKNAHDYAHVLDSEQRGGNSVEPGYFIDDGIYGNAETGEASIEKWADDDPDFERDPEEIAFDHTNPEHLGMLAPHDRGYDIWKIHPAGIQGVPDPEPALHNNGWITPSEAIDRVREHATVWDGMEGHTPEEGRDDWQNWDDTDYNGSAPVRWALGPVPPENLSLHHWVPPWTLTQNNMMNRLDDPDLQGPDYPIEMNQIHPTSQPLTPPPGSLTSAWLEASEEPSEEEATDDPAALWLELILGDIEDGGEQEGDDGEGEADKEHEVGNVVIVWMAESDGEADDGKEKSDGKEKKESRDLPHAATTGHLEPPQDTAKVATLWSELMIPGKDESHHETNHPNHPEEVHRKDLDRRANEHGDHARDEERAEGASPEFLHQQPALMRPWFRGMEGKALIDNSGQLHTWAVNSTGHPQHDVVAGEKGIWPLAKVNLTPDGTASIHETYPHGSTQEEVQAMLEEQAPSQGLRATRRYMAREAESPGEGIVRGSLGIAALVRRPSVSLGQDDRNHQEQERQRQDDSERFGHLLTPEDHEGDPITCETCGEPLTDGSCPRCNWGRPWGDNKTWTTDNPRADSVYDLTKGIRGSSVRRIWERVKTLHR